MLSGTPSSAEKVMGGTTGREGEAWCGRDRSVSVGEQSVIKRLLMDLLMNETSRNPSVCVHSASANTTSISYGFCVDEYARVHSPTLLQLPSFLPYANS